LEFKGIIVVAHSIASTVYAIKWDAMITTIIDIVTNICIMKPVLVIEGRNEDRSITLPASVNEKPWN
jgi:hypothetical protein